MLCCGFVGRGVKYVALPLVFSYFLLAISRDPGDREPSQNFLCQEWDKISPGGLYLTPQTQSRSTATLYGDEF